MKRRLKIASVGGIARTFAIRKLEPLLGLSLDVTLLLYSRTSFPEEQAVLDRNRSRVRYPPQSRSKLILLLLLKALTCPVGTSRLIASVLGRYGVSKRAAKSLLAVVPFVGQGFDLVHVEDGWLAQELLELILLKDILGFKVVVSFRGADLFVNSLINMDICRTILQASDDSHFVSRALMLRAREVGLLETRGRVIYPGVDPQIFDRNSAPHPSREAGAEDHIRLLSVGRLDWGKGYEYGLKAISIVAQRGIKLRYDIAGGGNLYHALRYAVWQMGLEGIAYLHRNLIRDKLLPLLRRTDIYVQPAVREGLGNAVLEAQSFGIPVVCTDVGGLPEAIEDGVTGFVVPCRDPEALADRICQLAKDGELRARMGEQGRKRVLAKFTLEQQAARFLEFYRDVTRGQQHVEKPQTR